MSDPLHAWFYGGVFEVGGSNGANSGLTKFSRYVGENKKLSYCWETVRLDSMPRIAEMDAEMTT